MTADPSILGQGRSGLVFKDMQTDGTAVARKVFVGDRLSNLILYLTTGAPNPYNWNKAAIQCAHYRRRILKDLVSFWFGDRLQVMSSSGCSWNEDHGAFELITTFSPGRAPGLLPYQEDRSEEFQDLMNGIMKPLQNKLRESGFDGLVWQAGYGNPVAANNFLLESESDTPRRWAWIDLESGVPALFPLNPVSLLRFYLPMCIKHSRALFDDVDMDQLRKYVSTHEKDLHEQLSSDGFPNLLENIRHLEQHQRQWKHLSRVALSIHYQYSIKRLSEKQKNWFLRHPFLWILREAARALYRSLRALFWSLPRRIGRWIKRQPWLTRAQNLIRLVFSETYRYQRAHSYASDRLAAWEGRDQIDAADAADLQGHIDEESTTPYLTDLFVHMALKPVEMTFIGIILPALTLKGWIGPVTAGFLIVWGGSITRTLYTLLRMMFSSMERSTIPKTAAACQSIPERLKSFSANHRFIALWVGMIPTFGNLAYPAQMVYSSSTRDRAIGRFMFYDVFTRIGENTPVWGGRDTGTEHFFNRLAHRIIQGRQSRRSTPG